MTPFISIEAVAASLPIANIDTDKILPSRFLKTVTRAGLGRALFADMRRDAGFVLNRSPWDKSQVLITGANFGCGSSREHAPWALLDFGIRCVIAPAFADIFQNNCFKNGILPVTLPDEAVDTLHAMVSETSGATVSADLPSQTVSCGGRRWTFEIDAIRKAELLQGIDEIERTLADTDAILRFEQGVSRAAPWNRPIDLDTYKSSGHIAAPPIS